MSNVPAVSEQSSEQPKFGGPLDASLGALALGAVVAGEYVGPANPSLKWILVGIAAAAGSLVSLRSLRAESTSESQVSP